MDNAHCDLPLRFWENLDTYLRCGSRVDGLRAWHLQALLQVAPSLFARLGLGRFVGRGPWW